MGNDFPPRHRADRDEAEPLAAAAVERATAEAERAAVAEAEVARLREELARLRRG